MSGLSADMLNKLTKADLYEIALANGKKVGFYLEDNEVSEEEFNAKLQEYRDETNGGKSNIIDIVFKILEKKRKALENVEEEEIDSNTGAFKTLAENLQKDFAKVKGDIEEVRNNLYSIDKGCLSNEIEISKTDDKLRDMYKDLNSQILGQKYNIPITKQEN